MPAARFHPDDRVVVIGPYHTGLKGWVRGGQDGWGWYEVELDDMSDVEPAAINRMLHSILFNEDELEFSD